MSQPITKAAETALNERVLYQGNAATVRWRGSVAGKAGEWLGLELDDSALGRHDGTVDGVRLFDCTDGAGVLVRPGNARLRRARSLGEAVVDHYIDLDLDRPSDGPHTLPNALSLDAQAISTATLDSLEVSLLSNVTRLDLSRNLIDSLQIVFNIAQQLPQLTSLCIECIHFLTLALARGYSCNRIVNTAIASSPLLQLRQLSASKTGLTWRIICDLVPLLPALEDLTFGWNGLKGISATPSTLLRSINLEGNALDDWADICTALASLSSLQTLVLASNSFSTLGACAPDAVFQSLRSLSLRDNNITSIEELDNLLSITPVLLDITLAGNPCYEDLTTQDARKEVLRHLPRLQRLDRSEVTAAERPVAATTHGELGDQSAILRRSTTPAKPTTTLASKLIDIHIGTPDGTVTVRLLPSTTLVNARRRIAKTLNLASTDFMLLRDEEELTDDDATLERLGIVARDCLHLVIH